MGRRDLLDRLRRYNRDGAQRLSEGLDDSVFKQRLAGPDG
jgi:hypothetical protein